MGRQLWIPASDARRNRIWWPPRRWEEQLVESWGKNWFDTEQTWDLALLADAIGAKYLRLPTSRDSSVF